MAQLNSALKAQATFIFENTDSSNAKRLCLFPGHFDTQKLDVILDDYTKGESTAKAVKSVVVFNGNTANITAAGYSCDQVAYDKFTGQPTGDKITVETNNGRTKYNDFLNYIKLNGLSIKKMRVKNLNTSVEIFNQEMEISASQVGGKSGSDFITFAEYVSANAYDRSFIDIDLEAANLELDSTTLAFLTLPASSKFSIQFTL